MKGITTLIVVCALLTFSFGDAFAAKKVGESRSHQAIAPLTDAPEVKAEQSDLAPVAPVRRTSSAMVPITPGTYTIGAAGTYTSLSAAVAAINANGVDSTAVGNFIFEFIDASYTDTSVTIGPVVGQYGAGQIIFRPATGVVATLNFTGGIAANAFAIRINNCNNMTWDGSNSGGSDRSLTILPDTTTVIPAARTGILVQRGSDNITLKNLRVYSNRKSTANGSNAINITNTGFAAFGSQDNITINNCHVLRGINGISQLAANTANRDMNLTITNNLIGGGPGAAPLENLLQFGVSTSGSENAVISDNDINGIYVYGGIASPIGVALATNYRNALVTRNKIHNIIMSGGASFSMGIRCANAVLTTGIHADALISNNMVYDMHNFAATAPARGFRGFAYTATGGVTGLGTTIRWYHNSVYIVPTAPEAIAGTAFLFDWSSFGAGVAGSPDTAYFQNNIMASNTSATGTFTRQMLSFTPGVGANYNMISNNNLYSQVDAGAFAQWPGPGYPTGAGIVSSLADWQTDSGNDLLSVEGAAHFVSPTDLHINGSVGIVSAADSIGAAGLKLTDFDGGARDASFPDAGADEFVVTRFTTDLEATSVDYPAPTLVMAANAGFSPIATYTNRGSATLSSASSVICQILDGTPAVVYTSAPVSVTVGGYDNTTPITFSTVPGGLPAGVYTIRAIAAIAGDASAINDTTTSTLLVQASMTSSAFPYLEDFEDPSPETGGDGWLSGADAGSPNDWVIGTPAKTQMTGAHSGTKAYVTKVTGTYSINQDSYIFAPILDLSTFTDVLLVEFYSNFAAELDFDGGELQMSVDGGLNWVKVDSTVGTGGNYNTTNSTAWYNSATIDPGVTHISPPLFTGGTSGGGPSSSAYSSAVGGWVRSSTAVTGVAGLPDVRFRWHFSADGGVNDEGWAIDDVSFKALNADDIGVSSVGIAGYLGGPVPNRPVVKGKKGQDLGTLPNSTNRPTVKSLGAVVAGSAIDFETLAKNYGSNTQAAYSVGLNVDGNGADSDVNTDPLGFGDDDTLTMSWAAPTVGIHTAEAWTVLAGDEDAANDTSSFDFEVLAPEVVYYEGFNSGTWPSPGWDTLDVDGVGVQPASWQQDIMAPYEGAHSAGGIYLSSNGSFQIDDWLISPNTGGLLDVSYTVDSLSFYMGAPVSIYADSVEILVSTTGTAVSDFTTSLGYVMVPMGTWTKFTYALPNAATRYIAFRYLLSDALTNGNGFGLDNMRITRYNFANDITITPGSINYGLVPAGFGSAETLKVKNNGNVALAISSAASDNGDFVVAPGAGVVPPGDSANFVVTFTPSTIGIITGNIVFTSDADSSPDTVTVGGIGGTPLVFLTLSPDSVFNEDPLKPGKSKKPAKHQKHLYPNWSNLIDELNAQGGFGPGTSESDSAGGVVIGTSYMFNAGGAGPAAKWKAQKDSAKIYCWVRLAKWDFKKNIGKSFANIQKTLRDKVLGFHTGPASGLDTTTDGKFKKLVKQLTALTPKKQNNKLFAELVALKVNIAASAMGKTPAGFGDLIFDVDGNPFDEMSVSQIANVADSLMTDYLTATIGTFDSLYSAAYNINRSCIGALDTASFDAVDSVNLKGKLTLYGQVNIATVPYLKLPPMPFIATRISALNGEVESPEDFDDEAEFDAESMPVAAQLMQNYPNPFNPSTTIAFRLKEVSKVTVKIFNLLGQEVATLANGEELEEGAQSLQFSAEMLSSGVYFYRIEAQGLEDAALKTVETRKMMLLK